MSTLAILHSTIRKEEKLIIAAAKDRGVKVKLIDIRKEIFDPENFQIDFDVALERSVSTVKGDYAVSFLESLGVKVINSTAVARICEDKFLTSLKLIQAGIPTVRFILTFRPEEALRAVDLLGGFPVVLKPPLGSWGRLLAKVNDRYALEAIIEHKEILGSPQQKVFYMQEYIHKPGRDIRVNVIDSEPISAIYRESSHWITNTSRGGTCENCPISVELRDICRRASQVIGGGLLAMDVFETKKGYLINEINHTMEFKNSEIPTGVSISGAIVDFCIDNA